MVGPPKRTALYASLLDEPEQSTQNASAKQQARATGDRNHITNDALRFQPRRPQQQVAGRPKARAIATTATVMTGGAVAGIAFKPTVPAMSRIVSTGGPGLDIVSQTRYSSMPNEQQIKNDIPAGTPNDRQISLPPPRVQQTATERERETDPTNPTAFPKSTIDQWTNTTEEDIDRIYEHKSQAAAARAATRKTNRNKKRNNQESGYQYQDWDDIYDPTRPNTFEEFVESEERWRDEDDWKRRLYSAQRKREENGRRGGRGRGSSSSTTGSDRGNGDRGTSVRHGRSRSRSSTKSSRSPSPGRGAVSSSDQQRQARFAPPAQYNAPPTIPKNNDDTPTNRDRSLSPPQRTQTTISRDAVRYSPPPASNSPQHTSIDDDGSSNLNPNDQDPETSKQAKELGFGERMLIKHGWVKGSGLGAAGDGITNPLRVKLLKNGKGKGKGSGAGGIGATSKIVGGHRRRAVPVGIGAGAGAGATVEVASAEIEAQEGGEDVIMTTEGDKQEGIHQ